MTCGIYCLLFLDSESMYIGKSNNIEKRLSNHKTLIKHGKHYNPLLNSQNLSSLEITILETCDVLILPEREAYWVQELNPNLNISSVTPTGSGGAQGVDHGMSVYSKEQLLEVTKELAKGVDYYDIEDITGVRYQTIASIVAGTQHTWLKEALPSEYSKAISRKRPKPEYVVTNTIDIFTLTVPKKFCEEQGINYSNFVQMLKGNRSSSGGFWRIS